MAMQDQVKPGFEAGGVGEQGEGWPLRCEVRQDGICRQWHRQVLVWCAVNTAVIVCIADTVSR